MQLASSNSISLATLQLSYATVYASEYPAIFLL